jgi:hypothetical protein
MSRRQPLRPTGPDRRSCRLKLLVLAGERGAGNVGMPVDEGAIGIIFPRPHMQSVERRQPKAVGTLKGFLG